MIPTPSPPNHHPENALLVDCASGALHPATDLVVRTHLAMCPQCARDGELLDTVGGELLGTIPQAAMSEDALASVLGQLGEPEPAIVPIPGIPKPLLPFLPSGYTDERWSSTLGISQLELTECDDAARSFLIKLPPGKAVPVHTHRGEEYTLVLTGSFSDEIGTFGPGDFVALDGEHTHRPIAGMDEECICLAATTAPLTLTGIFARLLNPLLK